MSYLQRIIEKACDKETEIGSELRIGNYSAERISGNSIFRVGVFSTLKHFKHRFHMLDIDIISGVNPEITIINYNAQPKEVHLATEAVASMYSESRIIII